MSDLLGDLPTKVRRFLEAERRGDVAQVMRCDIILALLRFGYLQEAEALMGRPIKICPPAIPPWPPVPVTKKSMPRVIRVMRDNPCSPKSQAAKRYGLIRVGMTEEQLASRGVSKRDIRSWKKRGWLEMETT